MQKRENLQEFILAQAGDLTARASNWRSRIESWSTKNQALEIIFSASQSASLWFTRDENAGIRLHLTPDSPAKGDDPIVPESIDGLTTWNLGSVRAEWRPTGSLILVDSASDRVLLQSPTPDLIVGDVERNPTVWALEDGYGLSLQIHHQESWYGGGENFATCRLNGTTLDLINADTLGVGEASRYQSTPSFWSDRGVFLRVEASTPIRADFGNRRHEIVTIETSGATSLELRIEPAVNLADCMTHLRSSETLPSAPEWSYGLWLSRCFYKDQEEVETVLSTADHLGVPVAVLNLDARAWMKAETRTDFCWDTDRFEDFQTWIPRMRQQHNVHFCLWENPYVSSSSALWHDGHKNGFFAKSPDGNTFPFQWVPAGLEGFPETPAAGLVDFTNPQAREWWKNLHRPYLRAGVHSFKTDFGEEIPPTAQFFDGRNGWDLRNEYSDLYNACVFEVLQEEHPNDSLLWARSGHKQAHKHPVKWGGDSQTTWRALRASLRGGLNQFVDGAIFWSHDVGGFYGPQPEPELYLRWAQLGMWCSHIRCHGTSPREPWEFGSEVLKAFQAALKVRLELQEWFFAYGCKTAQTGLGFLRPMWSQPQSFATREIDDQFLLGDDVVVAPFLDEKGGRQVFLPAGDWRRLDSATARFDEGNGFVAIDRSPHIPVWIRRGSVDENRFVKAFQHLHTSDSESVGGN